MQKPTNLFGKTERASILSPRMQGVVGKKSLVPDSVQRSTKLFKAFQDGYKDRSIHWKKNN